MAQTSGAAPVTEEAFLADRQNFWNGFTAFTTGSVMAVAVILILMALFLL
jgi:hypothetical protein